MNKYTKTTTWQQDAANDAAEYERRLNSNKITAAGIAEVGLTITVKLIWAAVKMTPFVLLIWLVVHLSK